MKKGFLKDVFLATVPVLTGYIVLGIGFGFTLKSIGLGLPWAAAMSLFIYAGSMQYLAIGLISSGASVVTFLVTTLMVNARHLFYGISMVEPYKNLGMKKAYLYYALTDETYSLVCNVPEKFANDKENFYFFVSLFDHCYWVAGSVIGSLLGSVIKINTEGIDFALTALFITVFTDQWLKSRNHIPAIIGAGVSVVCLLIFGSENFLIPSMVLITLLLSVLKSRIKEEENG